MHGKTLLAAFALLAAAAGCGERPEPTDALPPRFPTTVRGAGEEATVVVARPARIVALDAGSAELVSALGAAERLVGVPSGYVGERAPGAVVATEANGGVDLAAATRVEADLVVATAATDAFDVRTVADDLGAALYLQPDRSLPDVQRAAVELGYLVGAPVEARRLAAAIGAEAEAVVERVEALPRVRVFVDGGFLVTVPPDSLAADLVRRAGGANVADEEAGAGAHSLCGVVRLEPDVYLRLTGPADRGLPEPNFDRCPGDASGIRYVELRADLVTRAGPRVAAALEEVARALHPDAF